MGMPSSSKCSVSSLAFARGLPWHRTATTLTDLICSTVAEVAAAEKQEDKVQIYLVLATAGNEKTLRGSVSIYKPLGGDTLT
jgi:hypothetical protein